MADASRTDDPAVSQEATYWVQESREERERHRCGEMKRSDSPEKALLETDSICSSQNIEVVDRQPHLCHSVRGGVRMNLLKIGPAAALALSGAALCLLALAPLGSRI